MAQVISLSEALESAQSGFAAGENLETGLAQVRMNNVTTAGSLDWSRIRRVSSSRERLAKYSLITGDVLFNHTNSPELVGKSALFAGASEPTVFSNHFLRLRVSKSLLSPSYLSLWLHYQWRNRVFENICTQWVNQATVRRDDLLDLQLILPSLPDQERIAALLEKADRLRRTRRYARQLSDTFLQSVFLEMFGDPAANPGRFELVELSGLYSSDREGVKCGPFGSALKKHEYVDSGIPVWTMENVSENEFSEEHCLYITPEKADELNSYSAQNEDILISRAGTVGRMAVVRTNEPRSVIHSNLIRLSLDRRKLLPIVFTTLMTHFASRVGRLKSGQDTAYTFMSTTVLGNLRIPLPPLPLQQKFARVVQRFERCRSQQREAERQANQLFQCLLHRAFSEGGI